MNEKMKLYAVVGRPVLHSLSPQAFRAAFSSAGIGAAYTRLAADHGAQALKAARAMGIDGLNVTAPFKEEIARFVDRLDETASMLGAVNTVIFDHGEAIGHNTDPDGVEGALAASDVSVRGEEAVVLGVGGAAKAAALALKRMGAGKISIVCRKSRSEIAFAKDFLNVIAPWENAAAAMKSARVIISCVPPGAEMPEGMRFSKDQFVLDASYVASAARKAASSAGCRYANGLSWLVAQAESAFRIFTGAKPETGVMRFAVEAARRIPTPGDLSLIGMTGAGKTTVGRLLGQKLDKRFEDSDAFVETREGRSIAEIFEQAGEAWFRSLEAMAVGELCVRSGNVVALGGGALCDPQGISRATSNRIAVWVFADSATCAQRAADGTRPLLKTLDPVSVVESLAAARTASYAAAAELVVDASNKSAEETAERIAYEMRTTRAY